MPAERRVLRGVVRNGVVVLQGTVLPEGTEVEVVLPAPAGEDAARPGDVDPRRGDEWEREE